MTAPAAELPFERQATPWSCGAAALAMVYRSLGLAGDQAAIWAAVAGQDAHGRWCARAQALAADALRRGLHALVIQVRDPWLGLERCLAPAVRAVVNHAPDANARGGHFSVLAGLDADRVMLHDPSHGPARAVPRREFSRLWGPSPGSELAGHVLIAVAAVPSRLPACPLCAAEAGDAISCPGCGREVRLQPLSVLRCLTDWCPMRAWETVFCPHCDRPWSKGLAAATPPAGGSACGSP